nr:RsmB/NOP family class I SAM-dependent RNA methyltransferase [Sphingomonas jejuensis]
MLDEIVAAARDGGPAADTLIQRGFAARRYAGSGDRRAIRELIYAAIRRAGERPESGRAAMVGLAAEDPALAALFDGSARGPQPIAAGEASAPAGIAPRWIADRLTRSLDADGLAALLDRAPVDLRVNRARTTRERMLAEFSEAEPSPLSPDGLRLQPGAAAGIDRHPRTVDGSVEVQDEGSQIVAGAARAGAGMLVVDLCAGAGGKSLAIAAATPDARIVACDTDRARLQRLPPRAERAGVTGIETRLLDPGRETERLDDLAGQADVVVVDAPCSGTGTWRRNPEARWRLTPARLEALVTLQRRLIRIAAGLVRPGGALVYITCSLLPEEGPDAVADFLAEHPGWRAEDPINGLGEPAGAGRRLQPATHGTDGFFVARLLRP